jgi:ribosomal-protein-alanine N-acetyltransferase
VGPPAGAGAVVVRSMTAADLTDVLAIERDAFAVPWTEATFRGLLGRRSTHMLVAEAGAAGEAGERAVIGYAAVWVVLDQAELGDIAVAPAWRRQGVATTLLEAVLDRLASGGVREVFLEVRVSNRGAQALYARHGFDEVGRRKDYYTSPREDALVMRRGVAPPAVERTSAADAAPPIV